MAEFVFENNPFTRTPADDAENGDAALVESLGDRMGDRCAHTTSDAKSPAGLDQVGRFAQGAGDVGDVFTDLKSDQLACAFAHGLNDEGDGAFGRVGIGDGQGDAFRSLGAMDDDELTGLADPSDARGEYIEASDIRTEAMFGEDFMHNRDSPKRAVREGEPRG